MVVDFPPGRKIVRKLAWEGGSRGELGRGSGSLARAVFRGAELSGRGSAPPAHGSRPRHSPLSAQFSVPAEKICCKMVSEFPPGRKIVQKLAWEGGTGGVGQGRRVAGKGYFPRGRSSRATALRDPCRLLAPYAFRTILRSSGKDLLQNGQRLPPGRKIVRKLAREGGRWGEWGGGGGRAASGLGD